MGAFEFIAGDGAPPKRAPGSHNLRLGGASAPDVFGSSVPGKRWSLFANMAGQVRRWRSVIVPELQLRPCALVVPLHVAATAPPRWRPLQAPAWRRVGGAVLIVLGLWTGGMALGVGARDQGTTTEMHHPM